MGLVRPNQQYERLSLYSLKHLLKDNNIEINIEIDLDPYSSPDEIIATGKLKTLKNRARSKVKKFMNYVIVIMVELGLDLHMARSFMVACHRSDMKTNEYVYILPWLAHVRFCE